MLSYSDREWDSTRGSGGRGALLVLGGFGVDLFGHQSRISSIRRSESLWADGEDPERRLHTTEIRLLNPFPTTMMPDPQGKPVKVGLRDITGD